LRREVPWLKRLPSEYVSEHVWLTTQPLETSPKRDQVIQLLSWIGGDRKLVYSSDYPHWDADELSHVASRLPEAWHRRVFFENALEFYGWTAADLPAPAAMAVT
jgi:predicted TIM-barrel fold metal-dependent hydrolase